MSLFPHGKMKSAETFFECTILLCIDLNGMNKFLMLEIKLFPFYVESLNVEYISGIKTSCSQNNITGQIPVEPGRLAFKSRFCHSLVFTCARVYNLSKSLLTSFMKWVYLIGLYCRIFGENVVYIPLNTFNSLMDIISLP